MTNEESFSNYVKLLEGWKGFTWCEMFWQGEERVWSQKRRSSWNSGGRMASAEGGSVPSRVRCEEGCPLPSWLEGLGSVVSSPSGIRGRAPARNGFWRILRATEHFLLYLYDKIWGNNLHWRPPLQILGTWLPTMGLAPDHVWSGASELVTWWTCHMRYVTRSLFHTATSSQWLTHNERTSVCLK